MCSGMDIVEINKPEDIATLNYHNGYLSQPGVAI